MGENPFESGERKVIPAVLLYARAGDRVLMIHRNTGARAAGRASTGAGVRGAPASPDYHEGKWNGLGGKLEADESPAEAAARELREESGLEAPADAFRPLGVLQFPNFKAHKGEDWVVWVFTLRFSEEVLARALPESAEGELHWVPARDLLSLNLWPGDRHFIPYVVEERPFLGTIWYRGQEVARHRVTALR